MPQLNLYRYAALFLLPLFMTLHHKCTLVCSGVKHAATEPESGGAVFCGGSVWGGVRAPVTWHWMSRTRYLRLRMSGLMSAVAQAVGDLAGKWRFLSLCPP